MQSLGLWPHREHFQHSIELLLAGLSRGVALDDLRDGALGSLVLDDLVHDLLGRLVLLLITVQAVLRELLEAVKPAYVEENSFLVGGLSGG